MVKYEYKTLNSQSIIDEEDLNELGALGWNLINVIYIPAESSRLVDDSIIVYYFSRPLE